ncbi:MAG: hypothetical protein JRD89_08050 [Deltaproteobacteria bacterium]|nr:hypothetical protein [Deltaproteobacteria bacterium]
MKELITEDVCKRLGGEFLIDTLTYAKVCKVNLPTERKGEVNELVRDITIGHGEFSQYRTHGDVTDKSGDNYVGLSVPTSKDST